MEDLRIDIIDHGVGLNPENISNLFNKINLPDDINTHPNLGIGLGLYIASLLIEQIQGKIEYRPNPESGSIFSIVLPLQK
jgi:K+-sensing histidine kinase KdpD